MCFEFLGQLIQSSVDNMGTKLNSPLAIAAVGSFFGAAGGYVLVMMSDRRKQVLSKISHIKTAIGITHDLFNVFLGLKGQHIRPMCKSYEENKKDFINLKTEKSKNRIFEIPFDNRILVFPYVDFELVTSKLLEKSELPLRALIIAVTLIRVIQDLKNQINSRPAIFLEIQKLAQNYKLNTHDLACLYYGIRLETETTGIQFDSYSDIMKSIHDFCNDAIWFSKELTGELIRVGEEASKEVWFFRSSIGSIDYSDIDLSLMPKDKDYKDWREKFKKAST